MKLGYSVLIASVVFSFSLASAEPTAIQFTNKELSAAFVLIRPELNQISVNGRTGVFTPAPALKFFGVTEEQFPIDFSGIIELADIEFNQLTAKTPQIQFQNGDLEISVPLNDQVAVIHSILGSISVQGVTLTATLGWQTGNNGNQNLIVQSVGFVGSITGSGVLAPPFILNGVKKLMMKTLGQQITNLLVKPEVQESVQTGLLQWAKFYTGTIYREVMPASIQFFNHSGVSGIQFQVE